MNDQYIRQNNIPCMNATSNQSNPLSSCSRQINYSYFNYEFGDNEDDFFFSDSYNDDDFILYNFDDFNSFIVNDKNNHNIKDDSNSTTNDNQQIDNEIQDLITENPKNHQKNTKPKERRKTTVMLTPDGQNFRDMFDYKLEKDHKKIPKTIVKFLYNSICEKLKLPKMVRDEERSINKFFNNYSFYKVEIINEISKYLKDHPEIQKMIDSSHASK